MQKRVLVTGITGQDGAYLAKLLLTQGYVVYGGVRQSSASTTWRLDELGISDKVQFVELEVQELSNVISVLRDVRPDEVYNLAGQSHVGQSFRQPAFTGEVNGLSVARLLEAIRLINPEIRYYQASSSEIFGSAGSAPHNETTPYLPKNPYGISKLYAHLTTINYREAFGLKTCTGILFNHESPLRSPEYVTRKITQGLAALHFGADAELALGNLSAQRDWGHARDYMEGAWKMMQLEELQDFVLATGEPHSVEEFADACARVAGFELEWFGEGIDRRAIDRHSGQSIIRVSPEFFRPKEVVCTRGDASKAREVLGWTPRTDFMALAEEMQKADLDRMRRLIA